MSDGRVIIIENEHESPGHVYYFADGELEGMPARSLNCSCERCIEFYLSNGGM